MSSRTSVIMPVRNGLPFLAAAVQSVLQQLATDDELLVIDDASTDGSREMLAHVTDPRVKLLFGRGRGVSSARNIGLAAAIGDFIAFLDQDDLWPPKRHRTMLEAMAANPQCDAVYGRIRILVESGGTRHPWLRDHDGYHVPGANLGNALYRGSCLRRIGGFDETLHLGEDLDYFNRLQQAGLRVVLCETDGLIYRRHAANATNDLPAMKDMIFEVIRRHRDRVNRARRG